MAQRSIEETFQAIQPSWLQGAPKAPTIGVGVSSDNNDLSGTISQATQQISQLQSAYQQQVALITANTQALQGNTSAQSGHSAGGTAESLASGILGGGGLLSPLISGIESLFGGSSQPAPLPFYISPAPVAINATLQGAAPSTTQAGSGTAAAASGSGTASAGAAASSGGGNSTTMAPQITVNVSAMDSQSFMDRSADIASAVREAMLNLHPINDVVASL
jgi:hypothetical protein